MNRSVSTWVQARGSRVHRGFTLVELLVVIAIIGVLVGLLLPAVIGVRGTFNKGALKSEVQALSDAVEQYRSKHGDYPPDGASWTVMEAHLRKAFPDMLQTELNLLNPAMLAMQSGSVADVRNDNDTGLSVFASSAPVHCRVMDPAEALVFFLGGFSTDKQRPFTGPGGPFAAASVAGQRLQYNGSRQNAFFEFPTSRLTLDIVGGALISTDEVVFGETICQTGTGKDLLPVFMSKLSEFNTGSPYVYFDSRTYQVAKPGPMLYFNFYQPSAVSVAAGTGRGVLGAARPMLSEQINTNTSRLFYENKSSFQILSPGVDGFFGGRVASEVTSVPNLILFTSKGNPCSINGAGFAKLGGSPLILPEHGTKRPMQDDAGNMIDKNTLGDNIL